MSELIYFDIGPSSYARALRLQERLLSEAIDNTELSYLVLLEHDPPVITLGRNADEKNIIASREELARAGIEVHKSARGGDVTYHAPGQLVGYPIIRLNMHGRGIRQYIRSIEEVLIRLLGRFGIDAQRREGLTGVWVGAEKVAAIGIAVRRWVAWHGFALNVAPDMSGFEKIVPCGIRDCDVTGMAKLLERDITVAEVKAPLIECMIEVFGFDRATEGDIEL